MFFNTRKHNVIQWVACNGRQLPMRREQGLIWHGRWGACDPSASPGLRRSQMNSFGEANVFLLDGRRSVVNVLAPVVVVLEAGLQDALDEDIRWGQILEALFTPETSLGN